jgi:Ca-activated chloride channel homolog
MRFENPAWLALLAIIPVLTVVFIAGERKASKNLKRFVAEKLLPALNRSALWPRVLRHILIQIAIALIVIALARPSYGYHIREIRSKGADIIFAIDVSRSMLCSDITPNRLTRAKMAARDLLDASKGHRIGVIPFAGVAFLQCPLTLDADAVRQSIDAIDAASIPSAGTSLAQPIAEARKAFGEGDNRKVLVIFTDGEDLEGTGLREARATKGITIVTIGAGTPEGAPVPVSDETGAGYSRDNYGNLVTSRMDASSMRSVAEAGGGFYDNVSSPMLISDFKGILNKDSDKENAAPTEIRVPIIRYRWPLAIALALLAAESLMPSFRKKGTAAIIAFALVLPLSPNTSDAKEVAPSTVTKNAPPNASPARDNHHIASPAEKRASYNKGVEFYKKGDYDKAADAFEKSLEEKDEGESDTAFKLRTLANAGAAKLASAQKMIPVDDREMTQEDYNKADNLIKDSKKLTEKAMSLAPGDEKLRRNFEKIGEAEKALERHKEKPQQNQNNENQQQNQDQKPDQKNEQKQQNSPNDNSQNNQQTQNQQQQQNQSGSQGSDSKSGNEKQDKKDNQHGQSGNEQNQSASNNQGEKGNQSSQKSESGSQSQNADSQPSAQKDKADNQPGKNEQNKASQATQQQNKGGKNENGASTNEKLSPDNDDKASGQAEKQQEKQAQAAADKKQADTPGDKSEASASRADRNQSATGDQKDGKPALAGNKSTQNDVRREGDHTQALDRPKDEASAAQTANSAVGIQGNQPEDGNKIPGEMTPQDADRLLRILQKDEKFLPAGQTKEQDENQSSGRDW